LTGAAALLLAARLVAAPHDAEYRAALDLLYDGRAAEAQARLSRLQEDHPRDPVPLYLQALTLAWIVEQRPDSVLDLRLEQAADRAWAMADALVRADSSDARALFARGATSGVRSRHHLFRLRRSEAARAAASMREDLRAARALDPGDADVLFGLGLYDYYVDVLPRAARVVRFLSFLPGGDRARGLLAIEKASHASTLHDVEAQAQLYEIQAFHEGDAEAAAVQMEGLARRYPGWPLWGLKLAEHLRDRMGAYAESAAAARRVLARGRSTATDPGAGALAMARLSLAQSLLLDLRPDEARRALLPIREGVADNPGLAAEARLLLGRGLEMEGDTDGAAAHYRLAAAGSDREGRRRAKQALSHPMAEAEVSGLRHLGLARRAREGGKAEEAAAHAREALAVWPASREAALLVAEEELHSGGAEDVRIPEVEESREDEPAWLVPWSRLLRAQKADLEGSRAAAVVLYKKVYANTSRRPELAAAAEAGLRAPFRPGKARPAASRVRGRSEALFHSASTG
jgi:hypothetical protein